MNILQDSGRRGPNSADLWLVEAACGKSTPPPESSVERSCSSPYFQNSNSGRCIASLATPHRDMVLETDR